MNSLEMKLNSDERDVMNIKWLIMALQLKQKPPSSRGAVIARFNCFQEAYHQHHPVKTAGLDQEGQKTDEAKIER